MPGAVYPELDFDPVAMAKGEKSSFVRLNLASVLQRLPLAKRADLALALLTHEEDADDPFLPNLVWYGLSPLAKEIPADLVKIAGVSKWTRLNRWIARSLAPNPEALDALLSVNASDAVLEGISDAFKGIRKAPKPVKWDAVAATSSSPFVRELSILFGDGRALEEVKAIALDDQAEIPAREAALKTLIESRPPDLRALCEKLLEVRGLGVVAARGLALSEDPAIGGRLAKVYRKFSPQERVALLDTLVARPAFAKALLDEMAAGAIAKTDLTAFHARQIRGFENEALSQQLVEVWGELRDSAADKKAHVEKLKGDLKPEVLATANLGNGRALYAAVCGACHTMYGEGGKIGPDLTGSGRANLDYLLENIVDPGAVVSADYRMSLVTLEDGRALSGVIAGKDERTLTLRTLAETMTIDQKEVVKIDTSPMSMMPEGLLLAFPPDQVRDLIAYLMHPVQVPLPGAP
jgi:putative heme-binding domain-containing protein